MVIFVTAIRLTSYIQNPCNDNNIENIIERKEGYYNPTFVRHFKAIKKIIPSFIGIGIFDSDGKGCKTDGYPDDLTVYKWEKYEIENYFISQDTLDQYFAENYDDIFHEFYLTAKQKAITSFLFDGNEERYNTFTNSPADAQKLIWETVSKNKKMSKFMDLLINIFTDDSGLVYPMRKGEYYKLINYMSPDNVDEEIIRVLDLIEDKLS